MTTITDELKERINLTRAIETPYNGIDFRSRLEARWAIYFDVMGIRWHYEPECFEIDLGYDPDYQSSETVLWLPDFYLPKLDAWVEVKGQYSHEHNKFFDTLLAAASKHGPCINGLYLLSDLPKAKDGFTSLLPKLTGFDEEDQVVYCMSNLAKHEEYVENFFVEKLDDPIRLRLLLWEYEDQYSDSSIYELQLDSEALSKAASYRFGVH